MDSQRWKRYPRKFNHKPTATYCDGVQFDQSHMPDSEFYAGLDAIDNGFTTAEHRGAISEELWRRAAQLRKEPKVKHTPYEVPVVRMAEMGVVE